ncbi:MAG: response regulator [Elusimicrobia bacterium]|nr:response regulator [Elusimicrobiota bacterium]
MPANVLVVEDDPDQRELLRGALASIGCAVDSAASVEEGLRKAAARLPDLVITDIDLPDATGFELCKRLKADARLRAVPVVMVTGTFNREEDRLRAAGLGADAYLLKPYRFAELIETVRRLLV